MGKDIVRVLIADDSDNDRRLLEFVLGEVPGLKLVGMVPDGKETIAYLTGAGAYGDRTNHPFPDLLLLDLHMPRTNGLEVLGWLQGQPRRPKVIMLTASEDPADGRRALALGADIFRSKTCDLSALVEFIRSVGSSWGATGAGGDGSAVTRG